MSISTSMNPDQFTLTCISTGGPATTVTWTRDSTTVTEGNETVLNDPVTAQYTHTLTVTATSISNEVFTCKVSNNKPSVSAASGVVSANAQGAVMITPPFAEITVGMDYVLNCTAELLNGNYDYNWTVPYQAQAVTGQQHIFTSINISQAGQYTCCVGTINTTSTVNVESMFLSCYVYVEISLFDPLQFLFLLLKYTTILALPQLECPSVCYVATPWIICQCRQ